MASRHDTSHPHGACPHGACPHADTPDDLTIVARLRDDDPVALGILMDRYDERLRNFAFLTVRDAAIAEDVAQDVFVSVWERRHTLSITGTVASYLYRATRYRALDALKHERSQERLRHEAGQQYVVEPPSAHNLGEFNVTADEFAIAMRQALDAMPPRMREIFLMHRVQGMSYAEIAETLQVSPPTIYSQMSRATRQLAEALTRFR